MEIVQDGHHRGVRDGPFPLKVFQDFPNGHRAVPLPHPRHDRVFEFSQWARHSQHNSADTYKTGARQRGTAGAVPRCRYESYDRSGVGGRGATGGLGAALRPCEGGVDGRVLLGLGSPAWVFTITLTRATKNTAITTGGTSAET